jgi:DNA-directed RNA polymerase subunit RPC12/RpoP
MKCIRCGADNNLKERTVNQGRCKNCNHRFVFEPTSMGKIKFTDPFFAKAIADLSVNDTLFFTPKQLFYFFNQRLKRKVIGNVFTLGCSYLFFNVWASLFFGGIFSAALGAIAVPLVLVVVNLFGIYYLFNLSNSPQSSHRIRQSSATTLQVLGILILIVAVVYGFSRNSAIVYWLAALIGLGALWLGLWQKRRIAQIPETFLLTMAQMQDWLDRWTRINNSIAKLLPSSSNALTSATQNNLPDPDVTAYSFERLVVCQTNAIAQMLIANNFHFENNCAILSISGYPQRIFDTTMQMLRRNPELRVFAFHDCSPQGMELAHQLRTNPNWFPDENIVIVDIGLSPRQILAAKRASFVQASNASAQAAQNLAPHIRQNLANTELQWLDAGNFVELESFTPQKLIQVLNRSIASSQQKGIVEDSSSILVGDGGGSFYVTDSFG